MNILFAAAEVAPFIKTGGLADVSGSLPAALNKGTTHVRVVLPLYKSIKDKYGDVLQKITEYRVDLGWRNQYVGVYALEHKGVLHYFLDNEYYFYRDGTYGYFDDGERFTWFSKAAVLLCKHVDFKPDVLHTNDWHTAIMNLYVRDFAIGDPEFQQMKTVFTIHNLKYQGVFDADMVADVMGLDLRYYHEDGIRFFNQVNFMKAGIVYADAVTTVSDSYAREIMDPFFGEQLDGILRKHSYKLTGIVNGIDYDEFNPLTDPYLKRPFDIRSVHNRKKENKVWLQETWGLTVDPEIPMVGMVTRLVDMKGLDLVAHVFEELIQNDLQFVVLGTGDEQYEDMFAQFAHRYPNKVHAMLRFSEEEAHRIYGSSDLFLMPSMFEPCGISQLISLRYGTIPIVRSIGGLRDTVEPFDKESNLGNGFSFTNYNAHDMLFTVKVALHVYQDKVTWKELVKRAMKSKNDWNASSAKYRALYGNLKKNEG
jgi:starch synthase